MMDNCGGHGTILAIEIHTKILLDEFNIEIIHQVLNSPETNLLHLGVWATLQYATESLSCRQRQDPDVLVGVEPNALENLPAKTIGKVYKR